jgi:hypothetical protein
MSGPEIVKAAQAVQAVWDLWRSRLNTALLQADIRYCSEDALRLHAWGRNVERYPGEPVELWRARVLHAITAVQRAGSKAGLEYILSIHGIVGVGVRERVVGEDWDIVFVELDQVGFAVATELIDTILERWGRTCRRHIPTYRTPVELHLLPSSASFAEHMELAS